MSPGRPVVTLLTDFGAGGEYVGRPPRRGGAGVSGGGPDRPRPRHPAAATCAPAPWCSRAWRRSCRGRSTWPWSTPAWAPPAAPRPWPWTGAARWWGRTTACSRPAAAALGARAAVALTPPADAPATFHGRDLFAPAAARLASGERPGAARRRLRSGRSHAGGPAAARGVPRRAGRARRGDRRLRQRGAARPRRRPGGRGVHARATGSSRRSPTAATPRPSPGPSPTRPPRACWSTSTPTAWWPWPSTAAAPPCRITAAMGDTVTLGRWPPAGA